MKLHQNVYVKVNVVNGGGYSQFDLDLFIHTAPEKVTVMTMTPIHPKLIHLTPITVHVLRKTSKNTSQKILLSCHGAVDLYRS